MKSDIQDLPEELVERLQYIELYTGRVVRNALLGDYRSRIRGQGFNFDEHKRYQRGDDFRQIDWNVFARVQEAFVKKKLEDKELNIILVTDVSRSMDLGTRSASKRDRLLEVTATLAFSAAMEQIGVGWLAFSSKVDAFVQPVRGRPHVWRILRRLWRIRPDPGETELEVPLQFLHQQLKKGHMIFYLSDFQGDGRFFDSPFLKIIVKKHDFIPVVMQDWLESEFPSSSGFLRVRDLESGREEQIRITPRNLERYRKRIRDWRRDLRRSFFRLGMDHLWVRTDRPYLNDALQLFLNRKRRQRA